VAHASQFRQHPSDQEGIHRPERSEFCTDRSGRSFRECLCNRFRKWDGGHRILGIREDPGACYNITLVRYIRRLLASLGVPLSERGVEVVHFFELCARILGERVKYEGEEAAYYDIVVQEALSRVTAGDQAGTRDYTGPHYDAMLVDEGQDLSDDIVGVIVALLGPQSDNLTVAFDDGQDIYRRRRASWQKLGVRARGRVMPLRATYRNSREITADSVTICTVHSVKGLDFACVFLVGFDFLEPGPNWPEEQLCSLAYVAITRARRHLVVPWVKAEVVTERMVGS